MNAWPGVADRRVVITGATGGIGRVAATELARRGARVTLVARSPERAAATAEALAAETGHRPDVVLGDLAVQSEVRRVAAEILERHDEVAVLLNNAGAVNLRRSLTPDGVELTWAVNHLAPFLLTALLRDRLVASAPARVVTTASDAHRGARSGIRWDDVGFARGYRGFRVYAQSKLANILFTRELARRLEGTGVTAVCHHPGFVATGFNRNNGRLVAAGMTLLRPFARSPRKGADTMVWLADAPLPEGAAGGYFADRRLARAGAAAADDAAARRLWTLSEEMTSATAVAG